MKRETEEDHSPVVHSLCASAMLSLRKKGTNRGSILKSGSAGIRGDYSFELLHAYRRFVTD